MLTHCSLIEASRADGRLLWEAPAVTDIDLNDNTLGGAITAQIELTNTFTCVVPPVNPLS